MEKEQSNAIPVLVTFGSTVNVYYPSQVNTGIVDTSNADIQNYLVPSSDMNARDYNRFINQGVELSTKFTKKSNVENQIEHMIEKLYSVKIAGCTALGPALAISLGITSAFPGSQIFVCTDGEANIGVGSINNGDKSFYTDMGNLAVEYGTAINMITLENCNSGLEYLGSSSDISNGSVSIVNPLTMAEEFTLLGNNPIIASNVSCKIIANSGLSISSNDDNTGTKMLNFKIGNIMASNGDITFALKPEQSLYDIAFGLEKKVLPIN